MPYTASTTKHITQYSLMIQILKKEIIHQYIRVRYCYNVFNMKYITHMYIIMEPTMILFDIFLFMDGNIKII